MPTPRLQDVATAIGVSESAVSRYLHGTRIPQLGTMLAIERVYGWPLEAQARAAADGAGAYGHLFAGRVGRVNPAT